MIERTMYAASTDEDALAARPVRLVGLVSRQEGTLVEAGRQGLDCRARGSPLCFADAGHPPRRGPRGSRLWVGGHLHGAGSRSTGWLAGPSPRGSGTTTTYSTPFRTFPTSYRRSPGWYRRRPNGYPPRSLRRTPGAQELVLRNPLLGSGEEPYPRLNGASSATRGSEAHSIHGPRRGGTEAGGEAATSSI